MFFFPFLTYKLLLLVLAAVAGVVAWVHARSIRRQESVISRDLEALARIAPGGAPSSPIDVSSPAVVESRATEGACHACGASGLRVEDHQVLTVDGENLRAVTVSCAACGNARTVYLRIRSLS